MNAHPISVSSSPKAPRPVFDLLVSLPSPTPPSVCGKASSTGWWRGAPQTQTTPLSFPPPLRFPPIHLFIFSCFPFFLIFQFSQVFDFHQFFVFFFVILFLSFFQNFWFCKLIFCFFWEGRS